MGRRVPNAFDFLSFSYISVPSVISLMSLPTYLPIHPTNYLSFFVYTFAFALAPLPALHLPRCHETSVQSSVSFLFRSSQLRMPWGGGAAPSPQPPPSSSNFLPSPPWLSFISIFFLISYFLFFIDPSLFFLDPPLLTPK